MASADNQSFSGEQIGFRISIIIHGEHIFRSPKMTILKAFFADRNEFAFITGGATAFRKPVDRGIPEQIFFTLHDALDIGFQVVVLVDGNGFFKIFNGK